MKDAENEIEELLVKLKDVEAIKTQLNEQIENEKKEFDEHTKELNDNIIGIEAALTEVRRAAGLDVPVVAEEDSIAIPLRETPATTPVVAVPEAKRATPDVADSVTEGGVSVSSASEALPSKAPPSVSSDRSKVSFENKCTDAKSKDKQPSAQTTSSIKQAAAEILSLLQPSYLPSFEKRKSTDGPPKPPVERLKRRKPGFTDLSNPLLKSGRQPKVKKPASQLKTHKREPLAQLESVQPNMYFKKFGVRRKSCDEDSDVSWRGSDDDEEENPYDVSEEEDAKVGESDSGHRRKKKFIRSSGPTNELTAELNELVSDGRCETEESDEGEGNDKAKSRSSSVDPFLDSLFLEKCVVEELSSEAQIAEEEASPSEQKQSDVLPRPIIEMVSSPPPPQAKASVKKEEDNVSPASVRKWEPIEGPFSLAPLSAQNTSDPHPKLPGPRELGLVTSKTTPESQGGNGSSGNGVQRPEGKGLSPGASKVPLAAVKAPDSASSKPLIVVSSEQPTGVRRAGTTRKPLDPHESRENLLDPDDYRRTTLTWNLLERHSDLWAHLHTFKQLRARWGKKNDKFAVDCLHPSDCTHQSHSLIELRRHMFKTHSVKTYVCLMCTAAYAKKSGLIKHCEKEHDGYMGKYWEGHRDMRNW